MARKNLATLRQFTKEQLVQLSVNLENFQDKIREFIPDARCAINVLLGRGLVVFKAYHENANVPLCIDGFCIRSYFWANFGGHPWSIEQATGKTIKW